MNRYLEIDKILDSSIFTKTRHIKILEIKPINFELKSRLEKLSLLEAYRKFLLSCNFDIQILIRSNIIDSSTMEKSVKDTYSVLNSNISDHKIRSNINSLYTNYINFLQEENFNSRKSTKRYFLVLSEQRNEKEEKELFKNISSNGMDNKFDFLEKKLYSRKYREKENVIYATLHKCSTDIIELKNNELLLALDIMLGELL